MLLTPHQAREHLQHAARSRYAILAVNADSPAAVRDCLEAALACNAPLIIETSLWQLVGRSFGAGDPLAGLEMYVAYTRALADSPRFRHLPVILHTDHIKGARTREILGHAIDAGYSTLSLDSSELSEEENIATIRHLCSLGRELTLEMEAGVDDGLTPLDAARRLLGAVESTDPGRVWLWAPGVGSRHGLEEGGYPTFSPDHVRAHAELARELTGRQIGIALHGSSGLPETALREAVQAGVVKVNWSSESLLIRSRAAREFYAGHSAELEKTHPKWKETAMDNGVQTYVSQTYIAKVAERIQLLGGEGQAKLFPVGRGGCP
jgi:fructose-bisphosphate aldolase class II